MRPGQTAPECLPILVEAPADVLASMRPGQTAPECNFPTHMPLLGWNASMRPGQTAPECLHAQFRATRRNVACFNEAGADCPGMPLRLFPALWRADKLQ